MFSTWNGTQDVGWVRYTFDQYKVPYDLIFKERVLKGNLHADYDLIVIPTQARSSKALITDIPKSKTPRPTPINSSATTAPPTTSPEVWAPRGVTEFQKFTEEGGLLVTLGASSTFPVDFAITPKIDAGSPERPGSLPRPRSHRRSRHHPARQPHPLRLHRQNRPRPLGRRPAPPHGARRRPPQRHHALPRRRKIRPLRPHASPRRDPLAGPPPVVATPVGKGEVILFVTNPIWRWQNVGEFRMMFNTILNYKNLELGKTHHPHQTRKRHQRLQRTKDTEEETPDPSPAY